MNEKLEAQSTINEKSNNTENVQEAGRIASTANGEGKKATRLSAKAIVGFVLSLVGLVVLALPCGVVGVVFAALAMKDVCSEIVRGKGMAIAGLVISIVDIVFGIINLALL